MLLARGTYEPFKVESEVVDFEAKARSPLDIVVRRHDYVAGGTTGWHSHPGPVFITVKTGQLTFYEVGDPTCTPKIVNVGGGYVDSGHGHIARNESGAPATDVSVILTAGRTAFPNQSVGQRESELPLPVLAFVGEQPGEVLREVCNAVTCVRFVVAVGLMAQHGQAAA